MIYRQFTRQCDVILHWTLQSKFETTEINWLRYLCNSSSRWFSQIISSLCIFLSITSFISWNSHSKCVWLRNSSQFGWSFIFDNHNLGHIICVWIKWLFDTCIFTLAHCHALVSVARFSFFFLSHKVRLVAIILSQFVITLSDGRDWLRNSGIFVWNFRFCDEIWPSTFFEVFIEMEVTTLKHNYCLKKVVIIVWNREEKKLRDRHFIVHFLIQTIERFH